MYIFRFLSKIKKRKDGCWIWRGATSYLGKYKNFPYGTFWFRGRVCAAHRVAYILYKGEIPRNQEVDHLCKVTNCVNPDHLEAITRIENVRRSSRYIPIGGKCCRGHLMIPGNFKIRPEGFKRCLLCMKEDNN